MLSLWEVQEKNTFSSLHTFLQKLLTIIRPLALTLRLSGAPRQAPGGKRHPLLILVRLRLNRFCKQPLKACFLSSIPLTLLSPSQRPSNWGLLGPELQTRPHSHYKDFLFSFTKHGFLTEVLLSHSQGQCRISSIFPSGLWFKYKSLYL